MPRHEEQRNEHRDQRNAERDDGEPDLLGAFERGFHRRLAHFDEAHDVLDHHDGVIHDEAGGDRQRHQRKVVQAEADQLHDAERADDGQRQRHAGNDRGPEFAQENKNDHHHQHHREQQRELHVVDRGADGLGAVGENRDLDRGRQGSLQLRQQRFHAVGGLDDVRAGLALDVEDDGGFCSVDVGRFVG